MTHCDSVNVIAMMRLYKSAIGNPQRRLGFNAIITGLSALSALFVSVITLSGLATNLGLDQPTFAWLARIDLGDAGLALVAAFAAIWIGAALRGRRQAK
jgi:high-affinity nickel-transport protein